MPVTRRAALVLVHAVEEADRMGHGIIGTEHLLLGFAHENGGFAMQILSAHGVSARAIGERVLEVIGTTADAERFESTPPAPPTDELDRPDVR
jgi:ATP-dependent Clp protease ATP-binding subunit ClpC